MTNRSNTIDTIIDQPAIPQVPMVVALHSDTPFTSSSRWLGGKTAGLMRVARAGFKVPNGLTLTTHFFAPWLLAVTKSAPWHRIIQFRESIHLDRLDAVQQRQLAQLCQELAEVISSLVYTEAQQQVIARTVQEMGSVKLAVRSSSPEEDATASSFAGLFETLLNVEAANLGSAIQLCFLSCFSPRVLLYKIANKLSLDNPNFAVLVQQQIRSDISGVSFSINPLTNDFDELLINASWGLGEALVAGELSPDAILVNKNDLALIDYRLGDKGGNKSEQRCLEEQQTIELTRATMAIEKLFAEPMDIEWALAGGELHILQARPITRYIPLPYHLQTDPEASRHLYMDGYLTDGITMSGVTTPMTNSLFEWIMRLYCQWMFGIPASEQTFAQFGIHNQGTRLYLDLSMFMHLLGTGDMIAARVDRMNPLMASILTSQAMEQYRLQQTPPELRLTRLLPKIPKIIWRSRRAIAALSGPLWRQKKFEKQYDETIQSFNSWASQPIDPQQSSIDCFTEGITRAGLCIMQSSAPAFLAFYYYTTRIKGLAHKNSSDQQAWVDAICSGFEQDMIVQMGLQIYDLSQMLTPDKLANIDDLTEKIQARTVDSKFLAAWDEFVGSFGFRGPLEMEIANPKYGEDPTIALRQMSSLASANHGFNPHEMKQRQIDKRKQAYQLMYHSLPARKAKRLQTYYRQANRHAAAREQFKHHVMQIYQRQKKLLRLKADTLVDQGRLAAPQDIFQCTLEDVDEAIANPNLDLAARCRSRNQFNTKLNQHVTHFPLLIDSRGRILRAKPQTTDGAIVGSAVSPGVARGPIKILNHPFEKDIEPGDVLVAVTTDPGWTPLFINTSAIILEIGGELQHGALVAREYGKPCVSGIQDVTEQFTDGEMVEVDGNNGLVRRL